MKKSLAFPVVVIGFIVLFGGAWAFSYIPSKEIQKTWMLEQERYVTKSNALFVLSKELGFGGLIHNFKNYVLRGELDYLKRTLESGEVIQELLAQLDKVSSDTEKIQLSMIEANVNEYLEKARWMQTNKEKMKAMRVSLLDQAVRIDDTKALEALSNLQAINSQEATYVKNSTEEKSGFLFFQMIGWSLLLTIVYWTVMAFLKNFQEAFKKAFVYLEAINKLSPSSICLIDKDGCILEVNPSFLKTFKVPDGINVKGSKIETFVPDSVKNNHAKYREDFVKSDKTIAMNSRDKDFYAKNAKGEDFPVEIGISVMTTPYGKVSLAVIRDKTEEIQLRNQADFDHLTKINNRRVGEEYISKELSRSNRYGEDFVILLIDIDHFKQINDTYGHDEGDRTILDVVQIIESNLRNSDVLARWGGDEFLCLLPNTTIDSSELIAQKLVEAVRVKYSAKEIAPTLSIGCAQSKKSDTIEGVVARADKALYQAKEFGRNRYCVA